MLETTFFAVLAFFRRELWCKCPRQAKAFLVLRTSESPVGVLTGGLLLFLVLLPIVFAFAGLMRSCLCSIIRIGLVNDRYLGFAWD